MDVQYPRQMDTSLRPYGSKPRGGDAKGEGGGDSPGVSPGAMLALKSPGQRKGEAIREATCRDRPGNPSRAEEG